MRPRLGRGHRASGPAPWPFGASAGSRSDPLVLAGHALLLLAWPGLGLLAALGAHIAAAPHLAQMLLAAATLPVLLVLLVDAARSLLEGRIGLDLLAALAMAGALAVGEYLAAAVVALMYAGGRYLEARARTRATRSLTALLEKAPRRAYRYEGAALSEITPEEIVPGDRLLVKRGEIVPVDGRVEAGSALVDTSSLTGEARPLRVGPGGELLSGAINAGDAFDLVAGERAADSAFAGILRLVEAARAERAPMVRLADRYALGFLVLSLAIAGSAWWLSGDVVRAIAVLVIATPCPLILAVPVALTSGLSLAATSGVLVKGAGALEALSTVTTVVLDKTGTLTEGRPRIVAIEPAPGFEAPQLLRLAASLDAMSQHPTALAIVAEATARAIPLDRPARPAETPGEGVVGLIDGVEARVGGRPYVLGATGGEWRRDALPPDQSEVLVALGGRLAGRLLLADPLRPGVKALLMGLRARGVQRILLATGDSAEIAEIVTRDLALDEVHAALGPAEKASLVKRERRNGSVLMLGDGINDAPALAVATVGVAIGARGAATSAETADVVLLRDSLDPLVRAVAIAQRSRAIALQSVLLGIGLSVAGMLAAAAGYLRPVEGALLQEGIDVFAVLNALRAMTAPRRPGTPDLAGINSAAREGV